MSNSRGPGRRNEPKVPPTRREPDANRERMVFALASMVGRLVQVKVKNQHVYEGIFSSCSMEKDHAIVLLHARLLPSLEGNLSGPLVPTLLIYGKEVVSLVAMDCPKNGVMEEPLSGVENFKTDGEINRSGKGWLVRPLTKWEAADGDINVNMDLNADLCLNKTGHSWDQFAVNRQKYGVKSSYKDDLYTTPLDASKLSEEQRVEAARIAEEIEKENNYSMMEERDDDEDDEELKFAAVAGTGRYQVTKAPPEPHRPEPEAFKHESVDTGHVGKPELSESQRKEREEKKQALLKGYPSATVTNRAAAGNTATLNALGLEPSPNGKRIPTKPQRSQQHPVLTHENLQQHDKSYKPVPEMRSINAMNLEPAQQKGNLQLASKNKPFDPIYGAAMKGGRGSNAFPPTAPKPVKGHRNINMQAGASQPPPPPGQPNSGNRGDFKLNVNAPTFTPSASGMASDVGNQGEGGRPPNLQLQVTPKGTMHGTLRQGNLDGQQASRSGENNGNNPQGDNSAPPPPPPPPAAGGEANTVTGPPSMNPVVFLPGQNGMFISGQPPVVNRTNVSTPEFGSFAVSESGAACDDIKKCIATFIENCANKEQLSSVSPDWPETSDTSYRQLLEPSIPFSAPVGGQSVPMFSMFPQGGPNQMIVSVMPPQTSGLTSPSAVPGSMAAAGQGSHGSGQTSMVMPVSAQQPNLSFPSVLFPNPGMQQPMFHVQMPVGPTGNLPGGQQGQPIMSVMPQGGIMSQPFVPFNTGVSNLAMPYGNSPSYPMGAQGGSGQANGGNRAVGLVSGPMDKGGRGKGGRYHASYVHQE